MTARIKSLLKLLKSGSYKEYRVSQPLALTEEESRLTAMEQEAVMLRGMLESELPAHFFAHDRIGFHRRNTEYYHYLPFYFHGGNMAPDYETLLKYGMDDLLDRLEAQPQTDFTVSAASCIRAVLNFSDRYRDAAKEAGCNELYQSLCRVPHNGATTLLEACVFLKFIIYTLRCNRNTHITLGRFDKYLRPYFESDLKSGVAREDLLEIIEEFYISINFDTDLYFGIQAGDNGQSLVLGGCGSFDDFSHLCMEAALELNLIDPKINLRVDKNTSDDLYEFATLMTKQGMGFPQYCNDDVIIPSLIALGYAPEDAKDYAVAACWEPIIPAKGYDVPNIAIFNFPQIINQVVTTKLLDCDTFEALLEEVKTAIDSECAALPQKVSENIVRTYSHHLRPSPYLSAMIGGCIESGKDLSQGGPIYKNFGCHAPGITTAADSLAAIYQVIYQNKEYSKETLLEALNADFEGFEALRNRLLSCPKTGNADPVADNLANLLVTRFGDALSGRPNGYGGVFRAGTGSAQGYIYDAEKVGATADGRKAGHPYSCSLSPTPEAKTKGPISCIRSFTGLDYTKAINGGPVTMELHDTVFRNEEGIKKVAQLVKLFISNGGHQLQLNTLSRERLLDALEHPEEHKNLIVRVWGWSGYFNELERPFREHIINRVEHQV